MASTNPSNSETSIPPAKNPQRIATGINQAGAGTETAAEHDEPVSLLAGDPPPEGVRDDRRPLRRRRPDPDPGVGRPQLVDPEDREERGRQPEPHPVDDHTPDVPDEHRSAAEHPRHAGEGSPGRPRQPRRRLVIAGRRLDPL